MDIKQANEITEIVNKIAKCKSFLKSLDGRSYPDSFTIYYRDNEICELEESALTILINYYINELNDAELKLMNL